MGIINFKKGLINFQKEINQYRIENNQFKKGLFSISNWNYRNQFKNA